MSPTIYLDRLVRIPSNSRSCSNETNFIIKIILDSFIGPLVKFLPISYFQAIIMYQQMTIVMIKMEKALSLVEAIEGTSTYFFTSIINTL